MEAATPYPTLFWEDVTDGQSLPDFSYELSLLRLVAFVRATGLYDFVHHDSRYAQAVGARDAFISTPHVAGLFSRLLTDWSGPGGSLRKLVFTMSAQCACADMLQVSGRVGRKYRGEQGEYLVELVDLNIATDNQTSAARATAMIELPSRTATIPALVRVRDAASVAPPNQDMPEFARVELGRVREGNREPRLPLTSGDVHLWCEALEDWNPLYWDRAFAEASPFGSIIAPPAGLFYGADASINVGLGYRKPGAVIPDAVRRGLTGMALLRALRQNIVAGGCPFPPPDCPEAVVTEAAFEFFAPLRIGDTLRTEQRLLTCSPKRRTRLGEGYFLASENSLFNQHDELVKVMTLSLFCYRV